MRETDIVIIGAGPIGIELAAAIKKAGMDYLHLEAGQIGATMQWWAPGTKYFSSPERIEIAGVPLVVANEEKATRENYLDYLRSVVGTHNLDIETYTRVMRIDIDDNGFTLHTARSFHGVGGQEELGFDPTALDDLEPIRAKRIVLAIGDMHLPRMLGIPGEDLPHVSHYLGDVHQYANQPVTIVGGKNSAVEAAIRLFRAGARVTMVHRGEWFDPDRIKYWLYPEIEYLIKKDKIRYIPHANVTSISPTHATLDTGESIESRFVLLLTGYVQKSDLFDQLGIELLGDDKKPRHDLKTMETNVAGVYVAGTGSAGTQSRTKVFIETSHVHVDRILASLQGDVSEAVAEDYTLEES
jgi:thioredoxin reductase (NADPH)